MGFLDRLFGTDERTQTLPPPAAQRGTTQRTPDEIAVERYRYLLRTAPPETIEQVHREAFAKLTDEQRAIIYEELSKGAGTGERPLSSEPATLARAATRAEFRQPGTMERAFGGSADGAQRSGPSFGSMVGSTLLGTVAGYVIGSALVSAFLPWDSGTDTAADPGSDASAADASTADASSADVSGGDFGGDFGDFGGDFGF
jgi:hypothetical protein